MKTITVKVNGEKYTKEINENITLLKFLREVLYLTGTKEGCGAGECGACMVILNGEPVNSCLILAAEVDNSEIITIEGISKNGKLSPLQESFDRHHAVQCGFCTPGMIISAKALLDKNPNPTREEIKDAIEGNFCRCTGYVQIIEAIEDAASLQNKSSKKINKK